MSIPPFICPNCISGKLYLDLTFGHQGLTDRIGVLVKCPECKSTYTGWVYQKPKEEMENGQ